MDDAPMTLDTNGDHTNGRSTTKVLATIPERLIKALPPGFVVLIVLNIMFMGVVAYVVQHNAEARNTLLKSIIDKCLEHT
jgi:hypothetical protein